MQLENQNILFIVRTMGLGGTENVVLQLCEILNGNVNKIVVCSSGGIHEKELQEKGITHYTIPDIASKKIPDIFQIYFTLRRIIKTEQITIIHSHHRMAAFYTELIANKNILKIANAHNVFHDKKNLTYFAYHNTELIAVGEMVKKNLVDFFSIPEKQVCVIHNAIKPFDGNIKPIKELQDYRDQGYVLVGNIGRLSEQKGMIYFIEAAEIIIKSHPKVLFAIVGDGEQKEYLHQTVIHKCLRDNVIFLGYRKDVQNVMCQLDFVVLSSLWEGLPLTPIEAFSVGKSVVGTAVDGTPEIIRNGVDGYLVAPKSSLQLAEKIKFLIENPSTLKKLEQQAQKRYQDEFSFKKLSSAYLKFYSSLNLR